MKNILWISAAAPYDKVSHAGGKIHNYYLKYLKNNSDNEIKLVTFYWKNEFGKIDLDKYGIDAILLKRCIWGIPCTLYNLESFLNPFNRYAGIDQNYTVLQLKKALLKFKTEGYLPDIVILQWTEMLVLMDIVKTIFGNVKFIGIEEDVKFLNFQRAYLNAKNYLNKLIRKIKYNKLKQIELEACNKSDKIILNNYKDFNLLKENNVSEDKLYVWQPYFESRIDNEYIGNTKSIIFYGAMGREENWKSAVWFIENVFYELDDSETNFLVIGANPAPQLQRYASERVKIIGFVDDVGAYFREGLCLVAPLLLGAGVKIKVLEAMSSGIPVLTNEIGIEGIPAEAGKDFVFCKEAKDYIKNINDLVKNKERRTELSNNSKRFMRDNYDLKASADNFIKMLEKV